MSEYKICMYLQFWGGDNEESAYPGEDKLWFEILLDAYNDGVFYSTVDCNGFELPLSFMELSAGEREAMRDELMGTAATRIAELLERNNIDKYSFDACDGTLVNLQRW